MSSSLSSSSYVLLVSLLLAIPTIPGLKYSVTNNARNVNRGGELFDRIVGENRAKSSMEAAAIFIWRRVFDQEEASDRRELEEIRLIVQPTMDHNALFDDDREVPEIHISAELLESYVPKHLKTVKYPLDRIAIEERVRYEIDWRITFGIAHFLQWTANDDLPRTLQTGIAAVAVLEAHYNPDIWAEAGEGSRWDESFDVMAQFFYYINKKKHGFVGDLNRKVKDSYHESYIGEAAGITIDDCWKLYKDEYSTKN